jgi:hypothetical protein
MRIKIYLIFIIAILYKLELNGQKSGFSDPYYHAINCFLDSIDTIYKKNGIILPNTNKVLIIVDDSISKKLPNRYNQKLATYLDSSKLCNAKKNSNSYLIIRISSIKVNNGLNINLFISRFLPDNCDLDQDYCFKCFYKNFQNGFEFENSKFYFLQ